jgi:hypothetical protein
MSARLAFYMTPPAERRKLVEFIKKNYILVDVDGYHPGGSRTENNWWTSVSGNTETNGCGNNAWYVATAGGTKIGNPVNRGMPDIRAAWIEYRALADEDRKPALPEPVQDTPRKARLAPPAGSLILRAYFSFLDAPEKGDLAPVRKMRWFSQIIDSRFPGTDTLWVTEREWKAMIPDHPKKGDVLVFPPTLQSRILRYYAAPELVGWNNTDLYKVRSSEFTLSVDEASAEGFRLRLEGVAGGQGVQREGHRPAGRRLPVPGLSPFRRRARLPLRRRRSAGRGGGGEPVNGTGKGPVVAYIRSTSASPALQRGLGVHAGVRRRRSTGFPPGRGERPSRLGPRELPREGLADRPALESRRRPVVGAGRLGVRREDRGLTADANAVVPRRSAGRRGWSPGRRGSCSAAGERQNAQSSSRGRTPLPPSRESVLCGRHPGDPAGHEVAPDDQVSTCRPAAG